ncbi:hypothetical protein [Longimicrobium sp.]|uniref:hypothetical protein n=1 Tax=Longimicrobium sp. TaxID=2029185 RepID=UPI002C2CE2A7|nr:hypothetical protein [Longimicrobium sp.]HSU14562.1 hypothetical protein [Longimicrobium sp.]
MKKLRLDPEALSVEPFELEAAVKADGTVLANEVSGPGCPTSVQYSCGYPRTCGGTSCDTGYPVCYQCTAQCTV